MHTYRTLLATGGAVVAAFAIGMTATSWASSTKTPPVTRSATALATRAPADSPHALAALAPSSAEAVFHAITPCRIVDTRLEGGPLGNQTTRTYFVGGTFGFAPQGGKTGGCGIPVGATAIAAVVTAPNPAGLGAIRMWPSGTTEPMATVLSYSGGSTVSTGATVTLNQSVAQSLRVKNYRGPTNVFIDVTGYFAQQMEAEISSTGAVYSGSARVLSSTRTSAGHYTVTFDTDISHCNATASAAGSGGYVAALVSGHTVTLVAWVLDTTTHLETFADFFVHMVVVC